MVYVSLVTLRFGHITSCIHHSKSRHVRFADPLGLKIGLVDFSDPPFKMLTNNI